MPAKGPVSINIQTIFCAIPVMDMVAAYRVRRLRKYLLIMILGFGLPLGFLDGYLFPEAITTEYTMEDFLVFMTFYYGVDNTHFMFSVLVQVSVVLLAMYLVRRWSYQWNDQFSS